VQRRPTPELLDTDSGSPAEIAGSISDLRLINRWFGGVATTRSLIQSVARKTRKSEFSLLEVAAGDGSLAQDVRANLQPHGIRINATLLDRAASHLPAFPNADGNGKLSSRDARAGRTLLSDAFDFAPGVGSENQHQNQDQKRGTRVSDPHEHLVLGSALVADALSLPFPDSTFDLISCSLFAHHLSPDQLTQFASESLRVCRQAVLVNDLIRHPFHLALVYAGMPLYRSRITRHDAPASVRQAYTVEEMREFFQQGGAASVEVRRHYLYRMGVIAWKGKPAA
jgi:ubiquinone/menaquinone biosynthesis C-methylase UbiE